ncbi:hypothetical protein [Fulvimarina sp. MAC8]|uniref:hypothetical protein n=1 Tax=Fulvimarina sp. MAC8 TaxID=3162874 RepID=UPI0032EC2C65
MYINIISNGYAFKLYGPNASQRALTSASGLDGANSVSSTDQSAYDPVGPVASSKTAQLTASERAEMVEWAGTVIDAISEVRDTKIAPKIAEARAALERELKRPLGENERYTTLNDSELMSLSPETSEAALDSFYAKFLFGMATSKPSVVQTGTVVSFEDGKPVTRNGFESLEEGIEFLTRMQMSGIRGSMTTGGYVSQYMNEALSSSSATDLNALQDALYQYNMERFISGEMTVFVDAQRAATSF